MRWNSGHEFCGHKFWGHEVKFGRSRGEIQRSRILRSWGHEVKFRGNEFWGHEIKFKGHEYWGHKVKFRGHEFWGHKVIIIDWFNQLLPCLSSQPLNDVTDASYCRKWVLYILPPPPCHQWIWQEPLVYTYNSQFQSEIAKTTHTCPIIQPCLVLISCMIQPPTAVSVRRSHSGGNSDVREILTHKQYDEVLFCN